MPPATAEESLRALLRSTENLRVLLEAQIIQPASLDSIATDGVRHTNSAFDPGDARILAVIDHQDDTRYASKEGSIFVCTTKSQDYTTHVIEIETIFPLTSDLSISLAQIKRHVSGLNTHDPDDTGFSLTIHPGRKSVPGRQLEPVSFFTSNVKALRLFVTECRGLTKMEDNYKATQSDADFIWLLPYALDRESSYLFKLPQDLRLTNEPFHTRLSPSFAGSFGDDIADFGLIRNESIHIRARETSVKGRYRLKIRIGTFNVNGRLPSQDLSSWVLNQTSSSSSANATVMSLSSSVSSAIGGIVKGVSASHPSSMSEVVNLHTLTPNVGQMTEFADPDPDLLVLGFQELDLSTEALVYSSGAAREDAWCHAIFAALGEKIELYEKLASKQHVGMLIVIIAKKGLVSCFSHIQSSIVSTGIMGILGNKGGVAIRLTFTPPISDFVDVASPGPTTLAFINSHLAAFDENADKRNSDFHDISSKFKFETGLLDAGSTVPVHVSAYESDVLFWMGDLNYRIDLPHEDVRGVLASGSYSRRLEILLQYDQLKKASHSGKAFSGFFEYPITHLPTYRFSPGIETDMLGYDTKRKPAWTDRILYMAGNDVSVRQSSYTDHPQITMSDHRPVAGDFSLSVDVYDEDSYRDTCRKLSKSLSQMEDSSHRVIELNTTSVNMGFFSYKRTTSQDLKLTNVGQSPCAYRFVPLARDTAAHPEWMRIEPMQAILLPGESIRVTLTSHVDNEIAYKLNLGQKELRTTLILHTILGKDHFISVVAEYQRTCFANKLSWLTRLPGPVRSLNSLDDLRLQDQLINAPREIMRLINWMMSGHVDDGMFISPGDENVINAIVECLDTGDEFPFSPADSDRVVMLSFGETLLRLLDSLIDPIVPTHLHLECTQIPNRDQAFELLDTFPPVSVNVWISLTAFLHFLCQSDHHSPDKPERIATIFAPILLRDELHSDLPPVSLLGRRKFLLYFIT